MAHLRFMTAGESHGPALIGIIEGLPAGLHVSSDYLNRHLARRQQGYGRGGRMKIERDRAELLSGLRFGHTLGTPIAVQILNRDWKNWNTKMALEGPEVETHKVTLPRPGHADYAAGVKYGHTSDMRNVLERASARETAMRVALGSIVRRFLEEFGITIGSVVEQIGEVRAKELFGRQGNCPPDLSSVDASEVRCTDRSATRQMIEAIDAAKVDGDTLGGVIVIWAEGLPIGLGSHVHWDRKLDGMLTRALMSIPAIKGVENGWAFETAGLRGSAAHDAFGLEGSEPGERTIRRKSNRAGGLEGGVTNGELLIMRAAMKPLSTLRRPIGSVDLATGQERGAHVERSDVCAVPAAGVVAEAVTALVLAEAFMAKFGGDTMVEIRAAYDHYRRHALPSF